MIITTYRTSPQTKELFHVLKNKFDKRYSCKIFNSGLEESIIIKKSFFIGVQVTRWNNEIAVDSTFPNLISSFLSALISFAGIWFIPWWQDLEKEISGFLTRKYH